MSQNTLQNNPAIDWWSNPEVDYLVRMQRENEKCPISAFVDLFGWQGADNLQGWQGGTRAVLPGLINVSVARSKGGDRIANITVTEKSADTRNERERYIITVNGSIGHHERMSPPKFGDERYRNLALISEGKKKIGTPMSDAERFAARLALNRVRLNDPEAAQPTIQAPHAAYKELLRQCLGDSVVTSFFPRPLTTSVRDQYAPMLGYSEVSGASTFRQRTIITKNSEPQLGAILQAGGITVEEIRKQATTTLAGLLSSDNLENRVNAIRAERDMHTFLDTLVHLDHK